MVSRKIAAKIDFLLSREEGATYKDPGGKISICIVYPNLYRIGMSNLGFQGVYTALNSMPDVACERAFLPDDEDREEYLRTGSELVSMESKQPLNRFSIVAFSLSFENDYPHALAILRAANIPPRAAARKKVHPLLIMGGVCAFFNPEPVADFFDLCFVGEAEEMLPEFMEAYREAGSRQELFDKAKDIEGLYLPQEYVITYGDEGGIARRTALGSAPERIRRRFVKELGGHAFKPSIITPETEFSGMYLTEAMRGCPWNCRFCVAGSVYKPVRKKDPGTLKEEIGEIAGRRVGLIAPSLSDYPHTRDILCMDGIDFSITSLRASRKSAELVRFLRNHRSVSIAPEAGTQRLRDLINKRITEEDILETSRLILSAGIETLRLYFMVGLPTEGEEDIKGIISLVKKIRRGSSRGSIVLTLSTFVPKPFTAFQWHPMERMEVIKDRLKTLKGELGTMKGVRVFHDVPKYAYLQGLLARGDRRISSVLERMQKTEDWRKDCEEAGVDPHDILFRQRGFDEILPWDFIDNNIPKERLWEDYQKALRTG